MNAAVTRWNAAVKTQITSQLDSAGDNFRTTARDLRKLTTNYNNPTFKKYILAIGNDFDSMAKARDNRTTVSTDAYNRDAKTLRTYLRLTPFGGHPDRQVSAWQGRMPSWVRRGRVTPRSTGRKPRTW
ncbi:hypothetical protein, partial [Metallococcus carri]